jgi:hypothetical protein
MKGNLYHRLGRLEQQLIPEDEPAPHRCDAGGETNTAPLIEILLLLHRFKALDYAGQADKLSTPQERKVMPELQFPFSRILMLGGWVAANPIHLLPACEEKERLRFLYKTSLEAYTAAVNDLIALRGKTTEEEYERVRGFLTEARNARDAARLALEQHKQDHGC